MVGAESSFDCCFNGVCVTVGLLQGQTSWWLPRFELIEDERGMSRVQSWSRVKEGIGGGGGGGAEQR